MREIEFMGKSSSIEAYSCGYVPQGDANENEWRYGCLLFYGDGGPPMIKVLNGPHGRTTIFVHPETVGQYTGLKDKGGENIFEGDIVLYKKMKLPVRWDNEKAGFFIGNDRYWMMNDTDIEVIGNIHDNPELLEA